MDLLLLLLLLLTAVSSMVQVVSAMLAAWLKLLLLLLSSNALVSKMLLLLLLLMTVSVWAVCYGAAAVLRLNDFWDGVRSRAVGSGSRKLVIRVPSTDNVRGHWFELLFGKAPVVPQIERITPQVG